MTSVGTVLHAQGLGHEIPARSEWDNMNEIPGFCMGKSESTFKTNNHVRITFLPCSQFSRKVIILHQLEIMECTNFQG